MSHQRAAEEHRRHSLKRISGRQRCESPAAQRDGDLGRPAQDTPAHAGNGHPGRFQPRREREDRDGNQAVAEVEKRNECVRDPPLGRRQMASQARIEQRQEADPAQERDPQTRLQLKKRDDVRPAVFGVL